MGYVVAIDGPAGSGKGTITKIIEKKLGLINLDTGITYRCVALEAINNNIDISEEDKIIDIAKKIDIVINKVEGKDIVFLNGKDVTDKIRSMEVTSIVSPISSIIEVRRLMVDLQRKIAGNKDVVVEGRDICTVVFPNANIKTYLDASPEIRAKRRQKQNEENNIISNYEEILESIKKRDYNDMNKKVGALKIADDAIYIDSSNKNINEVVNIIIDLINKDRNKV